MKSNSYQEQKMKFEELYLEIIKDDKSTSKQRANFKEDPSALESSIKEGYRKINSLEELIKDKYLEAEKAGEQFELQKSNDLNALDGVKEVSALFKAFGFRLSNLGANWIIFAKDSFKTTPEELKKKDLPIIKEALIKFIEERYLEKSNQAKSELLSKSKGTIEGCREDIEGLLQNIKELKKELELAQQDLEMKMSSLHIYNNEEKGKSIYIKIFNDKLIEVYNLNEILEKNKKYYFSDYEISLLREFSLFQYNHQDFNLKEYFINQNLIGESFKTLGE